MHQMLFQYLQAKRTSQIIHRSINKSRGDYFIYQVKIQLIIICWAAFKNTRILQLKIFSLQLQHQTPNISCGCFTFDWSLYTSVSVTFAWIKLISAAQQLSIDH